MVRWSVLLLFALALLGCSEDPSADVVGTWAVEVEESTLPKVDPAQMMAAQMMLSSTRIEVREDGTFSLNLMASSKGTWKYDGKHLSIYPEGEELSRLAAVSPNGEVQLEVHPDRGQLVWPIESPIGAMKLVLVRAPAEEVQAQP